MRCYLSAILAAVPTRHVHYSVAETLLYPLIGEGVHLGANGGVHSSWHGVAIEVCDRSLLQLMPIGSELSRACGGPHL